MARFLLYALVFTVVPFLVLIHLYLRIGNQHGYPAISQFDVALLMALAGLAAVLGLVKVGTLLFRLYSLNRLLKKEAEVGSERESLRNFSRSEGEVGDLAKYIRRILTDLEEKDEQLIHARTALNNPLSSLSNAIEFTTNFETQVSLILELTLKYMTARQGAVFLKDSKRFRLLGYVAEGRICGSEIGENLKNTLQLLSVEERLVIRPVTSESDNVKRFGAPLACAALVAEGQVVGAICLSGHLKKRNWSEEETEVLSEISDNLATAFDLFLSGGNRDQTYFATLCVLAAVVELRDTHLKGHAARVAHYATLLGEAISMSDEELIVVRDAAKVHDIGNVGIHASVLTKPDSLNRTERELIVQHPAIGERIVGALPSYQRLLDPIRHHHEFLDGSGYPDRLRGDAISLPTRVLAVANIFDALTCGRAYRDAYDLHEALEMLEQMASDGKLDRFIVGKLKELIQDPSFVQSPYVVDRPFSRKAASA